MNRYALPREGANYTPLNDALQKAQVIRDMQKTDAALLSRVCVLEDQVRALRHGAAKESDLAVQAPLMFGQEIPSRRLEAIADLFRVMANSDGDVRAALNVTPEMIRFAADWLERLARAGR